MACENKQNVEMARALGVSRQTVAQWRKRFAEQGVCAALYGLGKKERESRARQLLEQFDLSGAGRRAFKAYSKGMKRKLTIATALIHEPRILFLDEPTTGIDVVSAQQIRKVILDLNRRGTTVFLTTHYIEEAERLCHRIAFIVKGEACSAWQPGGADAGGAAGSCGSALC